MDKEIKLTRVNGHYIFEIEEEMVTRNLEEIYLKNDDIEELLVYIIF
jgi:hypothetical protein